MIDIKELRRLAEETSNWRCDKYWQKEDEDGLVNGEWFVGAINEGDDKYPVAHIDGAQYFADEEGKQLAMYYAAANPSAILSLLDHIEQQESLIAELRKDAQAKLTLALPVYEKRRIVIASDELIDGERIVCVAIDNCGFVMLPNADNMTDEQAEAIAKVARCCGGIAYDIYRAIVAPDTSTQEVG